MSDRYEASLEPWAQRVLIEARELWPRIQKLGKFIDDVPEDLNPIQLNLLHIQMMSMTAYFGALTTRLELAGIDCKRLNLEA